jgi:thiol:disulfide interchange protein
MAKALNFVLALLIVMGGITLVFVVHSCGAPLVPPCFDRSRTLDDAQTHSAESGRPVLVFVTADWSDAAKAMKSGALAKSRVNDWIKQNTEPVYLDVTRSQSGDTDVQAAMTRLGVDEPPAIILLLRGREIGRVEGDMSASELLGKLQKLVPKPAH